MSSKSVAQYLERPPEPFVFRVFIPGPPTQQGNVRGFPIKRPNGTTGVAMVSDDPRLKEWRSMAVHSMRKAVNGRALPLFASGVGVSAEFIKPRLKSHQKYTGGPGKFADWPTTKPDLDKFLRAAFDALTAAGIIPDDCYICREWAEKRYAEIGEEVGVHISVELLEPRAKSASSGVTTGELGI